MNSVNIYFKKQLVGNITYDGIEDKFDLIYDESWIQNGFELSPALTFDKNYNSSTIKNFIDNLLPEGNHLDTLSQYFQISKNNKYGLILAIGEETTGALLFCKDISEIKTSFVKITKDELYNRIKQRKNIPLSIWDGKPRLSIAGVQDKLPVCLIDDEYGFGEGYLASTHILKFDKDEDNLAQNEYLSLFLASKANLSVAEHKLIKREEYFILQIKRFDREFESASVVNRVHIIDSVQALNLPTNYKYERNFGSGRDVKDIREGVSFQKLFSLIDLCENPLLTKKELIKWVCVNLILGNSDAHGKNISFFIDKEGMRLAPFYDIVNISLYKNKYEQDMAMAIDGEFTLEKLKLYDFLEFFKTININKKVFIKEFQTILKAIVVALKKREFATSYLDEAFVKLYEDDVIGRVKYLEMVLL